MLDGMPDAALFDFISGSTGRHRGGVLCRRGTAITATVPLSAAEIELQLEG